MNSLTEPLKAIHVGVPPDGFEWVSSSIRIVEFPHPTEEHGSLVVVKNQLKQSFTRQQQNTACVQKMQ